MPLIAITILEAIPWTAGTLVACGIIWTKFIHPVARGITRFEASVPIVTELVDQLHDTPDFGKILKEIIAQFRSDSGSTLRDSVNRIEAAAEHQASIIARLEAASGQQAAVQKTIEINQESLRQLAEQDRSRLANLVVVINEILAKANLAEIGAARIAADLDTHHAQSSAGHAAIAADLEATHARAEASDSADAGAAADAAMRRPDDEDR